MCGRCVKVTCRSSSGLNQGSRDGLCWGMSNTALILLPSFIRLYTLCSPDKHTRPSADSSTWLAFTPLQDTPGEETRFSRVSRLCETVIVCSPVHVTHVMQVLQRSEHPVQQVRYQRLAHSVRKIRPEQRVCRTWMRRVRRGKLNKGRMGKRKRMFCEFQVSLTVAHERRQHPELTARAEHQSGRQQVWVTEQSGQQNLILQIMHITINAPAFLSK